MTGGYAVAVVMQETIRSDFFNTGIFSIVKLMHSEDKIEHWLGRDWERQVTHVGSGRIAQQGGASADDIEAIRAKYHRKAAG